MTELAPERRTKTPQKWKPETVHECDSVGLCHAHIPALTLRTNA